MKVTKIGLVLALAVSFFSCGSDDNSVSVSEYVHQAKIVGEIDIPQEQINSDLSEVARLFATFTATDKASQGGDVSLAKKMESLPDKTVDIDQVVVSYFGDSVSLIGTVRAFNQEYTETSTGYKMSVSASANIDMVASNFTGSYSLSMNINNAQTNNSMTSSLSATFDLHMVNNDGLDFEYVNARANATSSYNNDAITVSGSYVYPFYAKNGCYHGEFRGAVTSDEAVVTLTTDIFYKNNKVGTLTYTDGFSIIVKDLDGNIIE